MLPRSTCASKAQPKTKARSINLISDLLETILGGYYHNAVFESNRHSGRASAVNGAPAGPERVSSQGLAERGAVVLRRGPRAAHERSGAQVAGDDVCGAREVRAGRSAVPLGLRTRPEGARCLLLLGPHLVFAEPIRGRVTSLREGRETMAGQDAAWDGPGAGGAEPGLRGGKVLP